jgi:spore coat assembly protein
VNEIRVGDIVTRRSYGGDIFFRVDAIDHTQGCTCRLRGICYRLCADAPLEDLEKKQPTEINAYRREHVKKHSQTVMRAAKRQSRDYQPCLRFGKLGKKERQNGNYFEVPGKVLHLDGDNEYRSLCQQHYAQLSVPCRVLHVKETEQAEAITEFLREDRPDILVLTGHDGLIRGAKDFYKMSNYRHSQYYVDAVRKAREFEPSLDNLIIIAGGCQSFFEALIEAGANFASAPKRILIHALDPLLIAQNIAFTSIYEKIALPQFLEETMTGSRGIGGVQTRGKLRLGHPRTKGSTPKKPLD